MRLTALCTLGICFVLTACVNTHPKRITDYPVNTEQTNSATDEQCDIAALVSVDEIVISSENYKQQRNVAGYVSALEQANEAYLKQLREASEQYRKCKQE